MEKFNSLKSLLVLAGLTQENLSNSINMSRSTLSLKLNNKAKFNSDDMAKIRDVLSEKLGRKLTIDEIFF